MQQEYYLKIHGHSCLEFRVDNCAILFDPWLNGSAYWRSWWNFPNPTSIENLISSLSNCENVFIYITHLHWDHFHGPTLRKLFKNVPNLKFLISRTPEKRLKKDLVEVLNRNIQVLEINHSENYILNNNLSVKPFLSGPILTDSAVLIKYKNDYILNLNDSKQQIFMMKQILSSIKDGELKVMLRSHSSANSRICLKNRDGSKMINNDKKKEAYSKEFLNNSLFFRPKLSIPFASNMCYLHKDTMQYNQHSNTSDLLYEYYLSSKKFSDINLKLVLPGEKLNLNTLEITTNKVSRDQLYAEREKELLNYRSKFLRKIEKSEKRQDESNFSQKIIINYFKEVFAKSPFYIRAFAKGKLAFVERYSKKEPNFFVVDFFRKKIVFNRTTLADCHTIIYVSPGVLNNALAMRNLNSLGISKLLDVHTSSVKKYNYFFLICISAEIGSFPLISFNQFIRSMDIWLRRWREVINYLLIIFKFIKIT